ncbi:type I restriction endonuclease [Rhodococcus sp. WB1]|uniref:DUF262 domain-containing protein n=1 Tax=Rhodococcus sp. WB1 TaxID=1033922 RepID=UPI00081A9A97|nr:DUF262 domain-containing protein [Rhodococcus sp. WB1]ANZ25845.1 type I restriction endonuclease [Rhodococcus sp. WB1]
MIKSVHDYPISQLMNIDDAVVYRIPRYQREYKWWKPQWEDLFDDIFDADASGYFLGSIICINQTTDTAAASVLEVVDGQQRLTTLSLLLAALYASLRSRRDQLNDEQFVELMNLKHRIVLKKDSTKTRVIPQQQNSNQADYFAVLADAGLVDKKPKVSNLGNRKIKKAFKYFESRIEARIAESNRSEVDDLLDMIQRVSEAVLVKIEVASHSDAYVLFESLNNRGTPLTPIDLIKNKLLATMETRSPGSLDEAFDQWTELIEELGDDYPIQERFFRQYYNAFRKDLLGIINVPVATKSNLIRVYEALIQNDPEDFMTKVVDAGELYAVILNRRSDDTPENLRTALRQLERAQGAPSYLLILFLMSKKSELRISEDDIAGIVRGLVSFFVRRNLTGVPQTYELQRMFMAIVDQIEPGAENIIAHIAGSLKAKSASDSEFRERLAGPIYEDNVEATRFILAMLAERDMTKETFVDLWAREGQTLAWTVEHVFPQGLNIPQSWIELMGGHRDNALAVQQELVHTIGNLTITRFNSNLGNKSFTEKRDRQDAKGRYIGYKNGLSLNKLLASSDTWDAEMIRQRTESLVDEVLDLFPLG